MKPKNQTVAREVAEKAILWRSTRRVDPALQIRNRMNTKGIKNVDMAERIGVTEANISRWLRGSQNLTLDTLYLLADAIEEPLSIIVGDISYQFEDLNSSGWEEECSCEDVWKVACEEKVVDIAPYLKAKKKPMQSTSEVMNGDGNEGFAAFA